MRSEIPVLDSNCPYQCSDKNQVLDRVKGKMVPCPHCREIAVERVSSDYRLPVELGFPENMHITNHLNTDVLVPSTELPFLIDKSVSALWEYLSSLWGSLAQGQTPSRSICIGLGIKGRCNLLAYPLMATAYAASIQISRISTAAEITMWKLQEAAEELDELYTRDLAFIVIEEGSTRANLQVAKGVMQTRGLKNKPTIFITSSSPTTVNTILDSDETSGYMLAEPHFLEYAAAQHKVQGAGNKYTASALGMLGVANKVSGDD